MIVCRELCKSYDNFQALDHLSLTVNKGDTFGFIGPNGAGKSTTLRILSTLMDPTSGEATIAGFSVTHEPEEIRRILGYMPDSFGIYDGLRVWEYLDLFASAFQISKSKRKQTINSVLELTELGHKREFFVQALSTGMRQRLCLAKTLLHDPMVLILDEPAAGLDPRARIEMRELLKELTRMGKTIMISSHILPELSDFCNTIGIIEAGKLLAAGKVDDIMGSLQGERKITISILRNAKKAAKELQNNGQVIDIDFITGEPAKLRFGFSGSLESLALLSSQLATPEYGLVGLEESKSNLEDIFMRVTKGEIG